MENSSTPLLDEIAEYYSSKLETHGETPRGVDWNSADGQVLRFRQLERILNGAGPFSLNDVGCGYGALYDYLKVRHEDVSYLGIDVSEAMTAAAVRRHRGNPRVRFVTGAEPDVVADYAVASGIFNVRLGRSDAQWRSHVEGMLEVLDRTSRRGFAFNCLTSYSDPERMRSDLYYADPGGMFDLCKRRYSRQVALLHDYGLYEFTILVRKSP